MKHIPTEILCNIFTLLHESDQMHCMLVCHQWKQVIERFVLYRILQIYSIGELNRLTRKIQSDPSIAEKIERLLVFTCKPHYLKFELNSLLPLLKNIRTIVCHDTVLCTPCVDDGTNFPFRKHIEYIVDPAPKSVAYHLLLSGICPSLTTLKTSGTFRALIPLLKNAPRLKHLHLTSGLYSFADFDLIHECAPKLVSIEISTISIVNDEIDKNINPAPSVAECNFPSVIIHRSSVGKRLLEYISKKYPNLIKLNYHFIFDYLFENDIDEIITTGWVPLLQNRGPQLKKMSLSNTGSKSNIFALLDEYKCQIDCLTMGAFNDLSFQNMVDSKQMLSVQTLEIFDIKLEAFDWLQHFQILGELKLRGLVNHEFNMTDLFQHCPPSLKSLSLERIKLADCLKYSCTSTNIESLSFRRVDLPKGVDIFISQNVPHLSNLMIQGCSLLQTTFHLPNICLNKLRFHACHYKIHMESTIAGFGYRSLTGLNTRRKSPYSVFAQIDVYKLLVSTTSSNQQLLYSSKFKYCNEETMQQAKLFFQPQAPILAHNEDKPNFTLVCKSLKNVFLTAMCTVYL